MLLTILLSLPLRQVNFATAPIAEEVLVGRKLAKQGKSVESIFGKDRTAVGGWFDGRQKRKVEGVAWLSPASLSRWLGYWAVKDRWEPAEILDRWELGRGVLQGKLAFIVNVASFAKQDPLELFDRRYFFPKECDLSGATLQFGSRSINLEVYKIDDYQTRNPSQAMKFAWFSSQGMPAWLRAQPEKALTPYENLPFGEAKVAWYFLIASSGNGSELPSNWTVSYVVDDVPRSVQLRASFPPKPAVRQQKTR